MAKALARYCDSCGEKIAAEALKGGVALKIDDAFYCEGCKGDVIPLVDPKQRSKIKKRRKPDNLVAAVKAGQGTTPKRRAKRATARVDGDAPADDAKEAKRAKGDRTGARRRTRPRTGERSPQAEDKKPGTKRRGAKPGKRAAADGASPARSKSSATRGKAGPARGKTKAPARRGRGRAAAAAEDEGGTSKARGKAGARRVRRRSSEDGAARETRGSRGKRPGQARDGKARRRRHRDETSEEEVYAPRRRKKKPIALIAGIAGAVVIIGIVGIVLATRSGKPDAGGTATGVETGGGDERAEQQARSEAAFTATQTEIGEAPTDVRDAIARWTSAMAAFQPMEAARATEVIADLKERYKREAQKAFTDLQEKIEDLEASGRYEEAATRIKKFNARYPDKQRSKLQRMYKDVRLAQYAALEAKPLLEKAESYAEKGDYQLAIGILEGFDADRYARTSWTPTVQGKILAYKEAESQSEQAASIEAIAERERQRKEAIRLAHVKKVRDGDAWFRDNAFEPWFGDDLFTFRFPQPNPPEAWKMVGDVLQATSRGALSGSTEVGAVAGVGSGDWRDYILEVEYKVVSGSFKLGVRSSKRGAFVMLSPKVKTSGSWEKITISVRGRVSTKNPFQEVLAGGTKRAIEFDAHDSSAGGVAFVLAPNSEVHFKNLGVKVLPDKLVLD